MSSIKISHYGTILLVEDEKDYARLILKSLQEKARVLNPIKWVKNGVEALEYITKTGQYEQEKPPTPALVLLDMKLPLLSGFEVLHTLKTDDTYKMIPVIMLTTSSNVKDVKRALELGANDYITKPIKFSDFTKKMQSLGYYWIFVSDATIEHPE